MRSPPYRQTRKATPRRIAVATALSEDVKKHRVRFAETHHPLSLAEFAVADLSPVPLALLSRRGVIISAGKPLFDLFGRSAEDVLFHALSGFLSPNDVPRSFKFLASCGNNRKTCRGEFLISQPNLPPKPVLLILTPADTTDTKEIIFRAAFIDLTENEQRDYEFRTPQQDTRLLQAIDGIVWEADYPMRFTFVSNQAERILGFPTRNWISDPDFWEKHIYHEDRERVLQARARAVREPSAHVLEYRMLTSWRCIIWVKDSAVIVAGSPGWTKMCGIITDVSDVELSRQELNLVNQSLEAAVAERTAKMQQSLDAMETLCYGIAHDLKAPLRGLQGFLGILSSDYQKVFDDQAKQYVARCQAALRRMGNLIEAVLAYGRLNHTMPEIIPLKPKPLIDRVLATLEPDITDKRATINVQMTLPPVLANPYLLEQVFTNLISNALKFSLPNVPPEISISATLVEAPFGVPLPAGERVQGEVSPQSTNPSIHQSPAHSSAPGSSPGPSIHHSTPVVRLTVTDNGIGIPPEATRRLFGMFQKLHSGHDYPGTGIGLALVKRAVELMNGTVGVLSDPGHGSSFWIELPSAPSAE